MLSSFVSVASFIKDMRITCHGVRYHRLKSLIKLSPRCWRNVETLFQNDPAGIRKSRSISTPRFPRANIRHPSGTPLVYPLLFQLLLSHDPAIAPRLYCAFVTCSFRFARSALDKNEYNHITATYFLLAERKLRAHRQEQMQKARPEILEVSARYASRL